MARANGSADSGTIDTAGGNAIDLEQLAGNDSVVASEPSGKPPRKQRSDIGKSRASKGTGTSKKPEKVALDLSGLAGLFAGMTAALSANRDIPELEVSQEESEDLAAKAQAVLRHYSVESTQKGVDIITLLGCVGGIVSTRVAAYTLRLKMEKQEAAGANHFGYVGPASLTPEHLHG
jgi:hypothetical protein